MKFNNLIDGGDGTVTDCSTALMWMRRIEDGEFNWDDAIKIPAELNKRGFAGYYDWRIPTKDELESIVMRGRINPSICTHMFPRAPSSGVWSISQNDKDDDGAWSVNFFDGKSNYTSRYNDCVCVRLVRGGRLFSKIQGVLK